MQQVALSTSFYDIRRLPLNGFIVKRNDSTAMHPHRRVDEA